MTYGVEYLTVVQREDIPRLDTAIFMNAKKAIETKLQTAPAVFGKPLRQSLKGHRSLRVEDYRIVYRVESDIVVIIAMRHRRDVYHIAEMRV